jgi:hypothetical protein
MNASGGTGASLSQKVNARGCRNRVVSLMGASSFSASIAGAAGIGDESNRAIGARVTQPQSNMAASAADRRREFVFMLATVTDFQLGCHYVKPRDS